MAARKVDLVQGSEKWKAWRRNHVGASEVATIMGISEYQTPLQLYHKKISGEEIIENDAMRNGKEKEPLARAAIEKEIGYSYPAECFENDDYPFLIASLDGYNADSPIKAIEIKAPGSKNHQSVKTGAIPAIWLAQCQAIMTVLDVKQIYFCSYVSDEDYEIIKVLRDDAFINEMLPVLQEFRNRLINFDPPDPMDKDLLEIDSDAALCHADIIRDANAIIAHQEKIVKNAKEELKKISGGRSCKIGDYRFVKYMRKGNIDTQKIIDDFDISAEEVEAYRRQKVEQWRFT